jgi:hypothetical protein
MEYWEERSKLSIFFRLYHYANTPLLQYSCCFLGTSQLLLHIIQCSPCQQVFALSFRHVEDGDDTMPVDLHRDFLIPLGNALSNPREYDARSFAETIIVFRVFEDEGQDPEVAEVGLVNPGKALGDLHTDSQITRGKGCMLSA